MRYAFLLSLWVMIPFSAAAYNPPVDTAGPLTVRMQPPATGSYGAGGFVELSNPHVPFVVPVSLSNAGEREISGTLRLAVIDGWRVEPASIPFRVGPSGESNYDFKVSFGTGTYNAHYPVHAYAEFEYQGKKLTAHPVLILQPRIPDLGRPKLPADWAPVPVPKGGTLGLWRMPVRLEGAEISNLGAEAGMRGREVYDAAAIIVYGPFASTGAAREGIGMALGKRPPSKRETVEAASVEYPLSLPDVKPLRLEVALSGGAAFAVMAAPFEGGAFRTIFQRQPRDSAWEQATVDLADYAGKTTRLRLEARGSSVEARWGEPTIVAGDAPAPPSFPPSSSHSKLLGKADGCEVRLWPGSRGVLDSPVGFLCGDRSTFFRGFHVRVTGDNLEQWRASTELLEAREESSSTGHRVRHRFRNWAGAFDVLSELRVESGALRARFWLENVPPPKPWFHLYLEEVSAGEWSEKAARIYAGPGNVIENPQAFRLGFDGHNMATSFAGFDFADGQSIVQNSDAIPDRLEVNPVARIYSLVTPHSQTLEFHPARNVFAAVKRIREQDTRQPSKGVAKLAGRFTFDLWSGRYGESARSLERAAQYGLTGGLIIWHNWQRWGYDYRLPDIYPPSPEYGTMQEFQELVQSCKRSSTLFAPHDNYIDFYPDFEGFSYNSIVFRQNGTPYPAWFHYYREAQSYRARPDRLMPYVQRNLRLIKDGFAPTAYFIDVWSSIAPYDYWTNDGSFVERTATQRVWGSAFAWIRDFLGDDAPQVSEAGHDKLIGWLDGAQAQQLRVDPGAIGFTWRIQCSDSERIPWFDVAWHDKFILHGAGYPDRYMGGLDEKEHGAYSDDYITTEVLSGRPPMVPDAFNRDVVRVHWLTNDAMNSLAMDRIDSVEFAGNNIHRQHVRWERGGEVWVNRGSETWVVEGHTLPKYGFYLRAGQVEASIELKDGRRTEWSRSPTSRYEKGRRTLPSGQVIELPHE